MESALSIFGRTVHHGQPDNNDLFASDVAEAFFLMEGLGTIYGDLATLDGDIISGFDASKNLFLTASEISRDQINVVQGSAILHFDTNSDGNTDNIVTLEGDFSDGDFMSVVDQGNTFITFETFLPELSEGQAVDGGDINGINNQKFLTGDGLTDFQVTLRDMGFAGYDNVLGAYEVDGAGQIVDARLLIDNVNADKTAQALVENVEAGHSVGFFIVQDAAEWAATLGPGDVLSFVNGDGAPANVSDGDTVRLAVNGTAVDETVFHSYNVGLDVDGVRRAARRRGRRRGDHRRLRRPNRRR